MTLDELKAEAKRQGFKLIPNITYTKLKPCKCGINRRDHLFKYDANGDEKAGLRCVSCGFTVWSSSERSARTKWNREVSK